MIQWILLAAGVLYLIGFGIWDIIRSIKTKNHESKTEQRLRQEIDQAAKLHQMNLSDTFLYPPYDYYIGLDPQQKKLVCRMESGPVKQYDFDDIKCFRKIDDISRRDEIIQQIVHDPNRKNYPASGAVQKAIAGAVNIANTYESGKEMEKQLTGHTFLSLEMILKDENKVVFPFVIHKGNHGWGNKNVQWAREQLEQLLGALSPYFTCVRG